MTRTNELSNDGRTARAEYLREWRRRNKDKCKMYSDRYWSKRGNQSKKTKGDTEGYKECVKQVKSTEVEKSVMPWNVLGKLDDGTYKGKCGNCGFVHYFIEGHDAQYRFCPQCGEQKVTF